MIVNYTFEQTEHRISITEKVREATNFSRSLWSFLKGAGWDFLGVVREHSMIVGMGSNYLALHHFVKDQPVDSLIGDITDIQWNELIEDEQVGSFIGYLETLGFNCVIPRQAYIDNLLNEMMASAGLADLNYHLLSPKHKLQLWMYHEDMVLHIEFYNDFPMAPYGVHEKREWPDLTEVIENMSLFDLLDIDFEPDTTGDQPLDYTMGEDFEIGEEVDKDKLEETMKVIAYTMESFERVVLTYSGGKDSSVTMQLYLHYYLQHPNCSAKLTIVSADTLIENPILMNHVYKTKERVKSLGLNIDFHIVKPKTKDTFYVCVFGKSMAPPSTLNKWCVSRLKLDASMELLEEINATGKQTLLVLGTRSAESQNRANSVKKHFGEDFFGEHPLENFTTCAPIKYWTAKDVLTYLLRTEPPWRNYGNHNIIQIYGSALSKGLECPIGAAMIDVNEGVSACTSGKSPRLGCSMCTVIRNDISLINMARDYEELEPLVSMRKVFKASQDLRYGSLTGYKRSARFIEKDKGLYESVLQSGFGDLTIDIRTLLLKEMTRLGIQISEEEVSYIYSEVRKREFREGIAITERFQDALFGHLPVHMGYFDTTYSPLWDPYDCGVDAITAEDKVVIDRILQKKQI